MNSPFRTLLHIRLTEMIEDSPPEVVTTTTTTPAPKTEWKSEVSFDGNGYIDLNKKIISHKIDMNWELKITFSTWIHEGLILWQGHQIQENLFENDEPINYIALGIRNSKMVFVSNGIETIGKGKRNVFSNHRIALRSIF